MIYVLNTNIEDKKKVKKGLTKIYGIGLKKSCQICDQLGITNSTRITQLTSRQIEKITILINQNLKVGLPLKQEENSNINRLIKISSYKGFRHNQGLPVRGQRTHTNSQTARKRKKIYNSKIIETKKQK